MFHIAIQIILMILGFVNNVMDAKSVMEVPANVLNAKVHFCCTLIHVSVIAQMELIMEPVNVKSVVLLAKHAPIDRVVIHAKLVIIFLKMLALNLVQVPIQLV